MASATRCAFSSLGRRGGGALRAQALSTFDRAASTSPDDLSAAHEQDVLELVDCVALVRTEVDVVTDLERTRRLAVDHALVGHHRRRTASQQGMILEARRVLGRRVPAAAIDDVARVAVIEQVRDELEEMVEIRNLDLVVLHEHRRGDENRRHVLGELEVVELGRLEQSQPTARSVTGEFGP